MVGASFQPLISYGGAPQPSITYITSITDTSSQTVYTFAATALGTAGATRSVAVAFAFRRSGNNAAVAATAVTINGVSASIAAMVTNNQAPNGRNGVEIWIANVPTGTTGDIVVTLSTGGADRLGIMVWAIYDLLSITPTDTATGEDASSFSVDTDVNAGGVAIGAAMGNSNPGIAWTGLTENNQFVLEGDLEMSGASIASSSALTPLGISVTLTSGDSIGMGCVAAFR